MKSLAGELTENERWSIKGKEMGDVGIRIVAFQNIKTVSDADNQMSNQEL